MKKLACVLLLSAAALRPQSGPELGARMLQLMESTAAATPGLSRASEPVRQSAAATLAAIERAPEGAALIWQFMNQVRAYLALSGSMPRPTPFPPAAEQQYAELREDLAQTQLGFEKMLNAKSQADRARDADPNQLQRYGDEDAKLQPAKSSAPRIVFLGDDATGAWRMNEYFPGRDFVNRGLAGQTTAQMLGRLRQDVLSLRPSAVVIMGGVNDIGAGLILRQTEDNLAMTGWLAKANGIRVAFASVLPVSDYHRSDDPRYAMATTHPPNAIRALNEWIEAYCRSEGFVYVDYYAAVADASGFMPADESDDGLHPNAKGYRVMSPVLTGALARLLAPESGTSKRRPKPPGTH